MSVNRRDALKGALGLAAAALVAPAVAMAEQGARPDGLSPRLDHRSPISNAVRRIETQRPDGSWEEAPWVIRMNLARGSWFTHFSRCRQHGRLRVSFRVQSMAPDPSANAFVRDVVRGYIADCLRFGCTWEESTLTLTGPAVLA